MSNGFSASRIIRTCPHICASRQSRAGLYLLYNRNYSTSKHQGHPRSAASISMGENTNGDQPPVPADASRGADGLSTSAGPRKLKILMLHGYTQSGPLFHAKTRSLEKLLAKFFPAAPPQSHSSKPSPPSSSSSSSSSSSQLYPGGLQLLYPTGPIPLSPADIPGYSPAAGAEGGAASELDAWGWWKRETGSGRYAGLDAGLETIAETIRGAGGIDGVIGFSQGAAAAAMVASLLEPGRVGAFERAREGNPDAFAYPESWKELQRMHPGGVKFAALYSGFFAPNPLYAAFYEPKISSPTLHFIGSLDTVVEESRSLALVDACEGAKEKTVYHPGGHFVPAGKEWGGVLVGFIKQCIEAGKKEEDVRDMDFPF